MTAAIVRGTVPGPAYLDPWTGPLAPVQVLARDPSGRVLTVQAPDGHVTDRYWCDVIPVEACSVLPDGQIRVARYSWHPDAVTGPVCADAAFVLGAAPAAAREACSSTCYTISCPQVPSASVSVIENAPPEETS